MNKTNKCQNCKTDFTIDSDDQSFYQKVQVPEPTFCPTCRFQRRATFRNQRKLFKINNAFTGEPIFSLYPPEANRKVVTQEQWAGDSWDPKEFGREIDWSKPFLSQILELEKQVPIYNLNVKLMVNSPYSGNATGLKNCYLCFNSNDAENCLYGNSVNYCTDCVDNSNMTTCERCYQCFWLMNCYQCYFTIMSVDSRNLWFCRDCMGCSDCFGCTNLRKTSHCIFNVKYTKEEYEQKIKEMQLHTASGVLLARGQARAFWKTQPNKYHQGLQNVNSTGSYVSHCKNVRDSFLIGESEDMRYCQNMLVSGNKDCYDCCFWGEKTQLCYETSVSGDNSYNLKFCFSCWPNVRDSEYCMNMFSSADCFGCVGMKNAQYCILNKQYTKEEYEALVPKIKQHMNDMPFVGKDGYTYQYGEFFPIEFSPFGYNNTLAHEYMPITEEEALAKGYAWIDGERGNHSVTKQTNELPKSTEEISDAVLKEVIACEQCQRPYRIVADELTFLQKEKLPLPHMCPDCRHNRRISDRLKIHLYDRSCMCDKSGHQHEGKCSETFKTGFDPKGDAIVYCEKCYQQEFS